VWWASRRLVAEPILAMAWHNLRTPGTALEGVALALVHRDAAVRALADQSVRQFPWRSTPVRDNAVDAPRVPPHDEAADPAYALTALRDREPRTVVGRF